MKERDGGTTTKQTIPSIDLYIYIERERERDRERERESATQPPSSFSGLLDSPPRTPGEELLGSSILSRRFRSRRGRVGGKVGWVAVFLSFSLGVWVAGLWSGLSLSLRYVAPRQKHYTTNYEGGGVHARIP